MKSKLYLTNKLIINIDIAIFENELNLIGYINRKDYITMCDPRGDHHLTIFNEAMEQDIKIRGILLEYLI